MANPAMVIKIEAALETLKAQLASGRFEIETTTAKMVSLANSYSGARTVQQAHDVQAAIELVGGVTTLTTGEQVKANRILDEALAKYKALGREAPAGMQALADATRGAQSSGESWSGWLMKANTLLGAFGLSLSIGALVSFGRALFDDADSLVKLHDKTEVSIQWLQKFQVAGDDAGNTAEELAAAVNMMQKRFDDGAFKAAVSDLKLRFTEIRDLSPEEQFIALADAVRKVEDPVRQVELVTALFGRTGVTVLPTIKRGFDDVRDAAIGMSDETTRALDKTGDEVAEFWRQFKAEGSTAMGFIIKHFAAFDDSAHTLNDNIAKMTKGAEAAAPKMAAILPPGLPKDLDALNVSWAEDVKRMEAAREEAKQLATEFKETQRTIQMVEQSVRASRAAGLLGMLADEQKTSQDSFEAWSKAYTEIEKAAEKQAAASVRAAKEAAAEIVKTATDTAVQVQAISAMFGGLPSVYATSAPLQGRVPGSVNTTGSLAQSGIASFPPYMGFQNVPQHETGGPTRAGMAMLHDGEYVVPRDGALVSSGGGDGGSVRDVHIHVEGNILGTQYALAQLVKQALLSDARSLGGQG